MEERKGFRTSSADSPSALNAARSTVYSVLARTFDSEIDEQLASLSENPDVRTVFETLCGEEGLEFLECLPLLAPSDFAALYIGPGPALAPPCESSYRASDGVPMGATTLEVRKAYEMLGYEAVGKNRLPDDHASTELAFMAKACLNGTALPAQADFLSMHLGKWALPFSERTMKARPNSGYALAAKTMAGFVERDAFLVAEMMEKERSVRPKSQ